MGNLEIFHAKLAQIWTPAPPPPPPPEAPQEYHAHTLETYQPGTPRADQTQYRDLNQAANAGSTTGSRGTQPLELPADWLDKVPPPPVDLSQAGSGRVSRSLAHSTPAPVSGDLPPTAAAPKVDLPAASPPVAGGKTPAPESSSPAPKPDAPATGNSLAALLSNSSVASLFGNFVGGLLSSDPTGTRALKAPDTITDIISLIANATAKGHATTPTDATTGPQTVFAPYEVPPETYAKAYSTAPDPKGFATWKDQLEATLDLYRMPDNPKDKWSLTSGTPLTDAEKQKIRQVYDQATEGATPEQANDIGYALTSLLGSNKLTRKEADGQTMLDPLLDLGKADSLAPAFNGTSKAQMMRDVLHDLLRPELITQGKDTLDCSLATIESALVSQRPVEFARMAVELATKGSTTIPGTEGQGDTLALGNPDMSKAAGRRPIDFAMQQAFGDLVGNTGEGLTPKQTDTLESALYGMSFTTLTRDQFLPVALGLMATGKLDDAISAGITTRGYHMKVTVQDGDALHSMMIDKADGNGVRVWDPESNKLYTMPLGVLLDHMVRASMPSSWLDGTAFSSADGSSEGGGRSGGATRQG